MEQEGAMGTLGEAEQATSEEHVCPECEAVFKNAQGLGVHRRRRHGYISPYQQRRMDGQGKRTGRPRKLAVAEGLDAKGIASAFGTATESLKQSAAMVDACLMGLAKLVGEAHKLRAGYIEKAAELRKLQVQIDALRES
jgi:uncharacterized C2H2 Zn-finger protein